MILFRRRLLAPLAGLLGLAISLGSQLPQAHAAAPQYSVMLQPLTQSPTVGATAMLTATVRNTSDGTLVGAGKTVTLTVISGPATGQTATMMTDGSGQAAFTDNSTKAQITDGFQASVVESDNVTQDFSNQAFVSWQPAVAITLNPPSQTLGVQGTATVTASVTVPPGYMLPANVTFNVMGPNGAASGPQPVVADVGSTTSGTAVLSYPGTRPGADIVGAQVQDQFGNPVNASQVQVNWQPTYVLTLTPNSSTHVAGDQATLTAKVTDANGNALQHVSVHFAVQGPNNTTGDVMTDSGGLAMFPYTGAHVGGDMVTASVTDTRMNTYSAVATVQWVPVPVVTLTPASQTQTSGGTAPLTANVTAGGAPQQGVQVTFDQLSSTGGSPTPLQVVATDSNGNAVFNYTSSTVGTVSLDAVVTDVDGNQRTSNTVTVTWTKPETINLVPVSQSQNTGSNAMLTATIEAGGTGQAGVPVTFTVLSGPNAGKTGSVTTDTNGNATFAYTGTAVGTDTVQASFTNTSGTVQTSGSATVTWTDQPISGSGLDLSGRARRPVSGHVAVFSDPDTKALAADYTATISWGDNTTSTGTISGATGGPFFVDGTHTYGRRGTYTITVTITDNDNPANTVTTTSHATIR
ncbi:Ig-like domain-containing protein [Kitasatospora sp. NPDC093558]|uniref:Ig-like domain-containing protein n=1 Tax=Kitasatospora sp. NPDC093558 TaxID=3155201 RepID=UPI003433216F